MTYELLKIEMEQYQKINLSYVHSVIESVSIDIMKMRNGDGDGDVYEYSPQKKMKDIAEWISNAAAYIGNDDDIHNIAVSYARLNMYDDACIILERGIKEKAMCVDLLADYIEYSLKCNVKEESKRYYERLKKIAKDEWNWRAFSFSIDYIMDEYDRTVSSSKRRQLKERALNLADEYIAKEQSDRAYYDKSEIYKKLNDSKKEREILDHAINSLGSAQQCRFRIADIEFEKGQYQTSIEMLRSCLFDFKLQDSINKGVAFLILAMSRASVYFGKSDGNSTEENKQEIMGIYEDIRSARSYGLEGFENAANVLEKVIEQQTGIMLPDDKKQSDTTDEEYFEF